MHNWNSDYYKVCSPPSQIHSVEITSILSREITFSTNCTIIPNINKNSLLNLEITISQSFWIMVLNGFQNNDGN